MAIDVKELRVGAHVKYKGERLIVCAISGTDISLIKSSMPITIYKDVWCVYIEPIPITEELLTELGFGITNMKGVFGKKYGDGNRSYIHAIECPIVGIYSFCIYSDNYRMDVSFKCKYLHEIEAVFYLTTQTELIKE